MWMRLTVARNMEFECLALSRLEFDHFFSLSLSFFLFIHLTSGQRRTAEKSIKIIVIKTNFES